MTKFGRRASRVDLLHARPLGETDQAIDFWSWLDLAPAWKADALCREYPDVNWWPAHGESVEEQKAICRRCLVREECLDEALATPAYADYGVWGATSAKQRIHMRRVRAAEAA